MGVDMDKLFFGDTPISKLPRQDKSIVKSPFEIVYTFDGSFKFYIYSFFLKHPVLYQIFMTVSNQKIYLLNYSIRLY